MSPGSILLHVLRPIIGPSSSHTYAPAVVGYEFFRRFGKKEEINVLFFGKTSLTCYMHGSFHAITMGLLGVDPRSEEIENITQLSFADSGDVIFKGKRVGLRVSFYINPGIDADGLGILVKSGSDRLVAYSIGGGNVKFADECADDEIKNVPLLNPKDALTKFSCPKDLINYLIDRERRFVDNPIELMNENLKIMMKSVERGKSKREAFLYSLPENLKVDESNDIYLRASIHAIHSVLHGVTFGRIVSAPTAGASGVLPGVLYAFKDEFEKKEIINSLFIAGYVGLLAQKYASVAGSRHGCQAEIGVATAMASAALTYLLGGGISEIFNAASLSLSSLLGLICDPVCGLVEIPCINRNAISSSIAITSARLSVMGIRNFIPLEDVFRAMDEVGRKMDPAFKETAIGGLAGTPTAKKLCEIARKRFLPVKYEITNKAPEEF